ncbi:clarin-2 isoform X3 [Oratosquilla oratoria]|uniref:clarin-2 isoform X3 n=1 Tax=Oratosquilla oratoria TaxID=337810 RepID=UPI003F775D93
MNIFKRGMIFITFFGCCFAIALMAAAMCTKYWLEAEARQRTGEASASGIIQYRPNSTGHVNIGLFKGRKSLNVGFGERVTDIEGGDAGFAFMDYGLWVATIASLAAGMLFAVVGALFAVINTATTPVEAITGVPGLYVWNTLAAVFNLVCVICWAVQFHTRLTKNVLVRDSLNGWTTEGQEIFGYSYWLVVVAIVVHIANCVIIGVGTYEPRRKEVVHAPHVNKQDNNILLY